MAIDSSSTQPASQPQQRPPWQLLLHPSDDPTSVFFLHPGDHPGVKISSEDLTGDNYLSWSQSIVLGLVTKNKLGFIDGSIVAPDSTEALKFNAWTRANSLVMTWILNSVSSEIKNRLLYLSSAYEIWEELMIRYAKSDGPRVFFLEKSLSTISQGARNLTAYYTVFKSLWDELSTFRRLPACVCGGCFKGNCNILAKLAQQQQMDCVLKFLIGLNDSYANIRSQVLLMDPIPSLSKVYSILMQEESQRCLQSGYGGPDSVSMAMFNSSQMVPASAHLFNGSQVAPTNSSQMLPASANAVKFNYNSDKRKKKCSYCQYSGHTSETCYQLHGYPPGWTGHKGQIMNQNRPRQERPDFRKSANVVMANTTEVEIGQGSRYADMFSPSMYQQYLEFVRAQNIPQTSSHTATVAIAQIPHNQSTNEGNTEGPGVPPTHWLC